VTVVTTIDGLEYSGYFRGLERGQCSKLCEGACLPFGSAKQRGLAGNLLQLVKLDGLIDTTMM